MFTSNLVPLCSEKKYISCSIYLQTRVLTGIFSHNVFECDNDYY